MEAFQKHLAGEWSGVCVKSKMTLLIYLVCLYSEQAWLGSADIANLRANIWDLW